MFTGKPGANLIQAVLLALGAACAQPATAQESVRIYTDTYRPYVLPEGEGDGKAMRLVRLIFLNADLTPDFEYIDFNYGYYAARNSTADLTFPWRETPERAEDALFSKRLFSDDTKFFYNIRFHPDGLQKEDLTNAILGRTTGYSYGEAVNNYLAETGAADQTKEYSTETDSLAALLSGEIDALPLPISVVNATLNASFPNQQGLIRAIEGVIDPFNFHLVAPKTPEGGAMIDRFNASFDDLIAAGVVTEDYANDGPPAVRAGDVARVVASEGFPVVVGVARNDAQSHYAVPQGTKVLVLNWSDRILEPSRNDRLYQTMVDQSAVLVLNGPHIGKELLIKNMHIAIEE
ncbi:MAG: transporter substrate-binding domain-containing protein [Pseudomonadota bacterium]